MCDRTQRSNSLPYELRTDRARGARKCLNCWAAPVLSPAVNFMPVQPGLKQLRSGQEYLCL